MNLTERPDSFNMLNDPIYIYLYGMIRREAKGGKMIHISKIHPIMKWHIRMPKKTRIKIIKKLVEYGFLKKRGRDDYDIQAIRIKSPCDSLGESLW